MNNMYPRICRQCGSNFEGGPRAWFCPVCRKERQKKRDKEYKKNGAVRHLGSIDTCVACGMKYIVEGGLQKYCKKCAPKEISEIDQKQGLEWYYENKDWVNPLRNEKRRVKNKKCIICGKEFPCDGTARNVCSDACSIIRKRQSQQRRDAKRKNTR